MSAGTGYHVFTRDGDGTAEVDALVRSLGSAQVAGLHRHFYVTRADQTVVMTASPDSPLALELRKLPAWREPNG